MLYNYKAVRGVAQFGSALGSGPRGRGFKSRHLDHSQKTFTCVRVRVFSVFINKMRCLKTIFPHKKILRFIFYRVKNALRESVTHYVAGETRFEHATYGFGDRYSTVEPLP